MARAIIRFQSSAPGRTVCGLLALLVFAACGGTKQTAPPPKTASSAVVQDAPPPLPVDPLKLLPAGVRELVSIDLGQLRGSQHFAIAEQWLRRYGCLHAEPSHFLLDRTERAVLATYAAGPTGERVHPLAVLHGDYRDGDVAQALSHARALFGALPEPVVTEPHGRFALLTSGDLSGVQLGDRLIAIGSTPRVLAALEVANARQAGFDTADELMHGLSTQRWLSSHSVAAITRVDERTARRIGRQLSAIGGRRLGEDLNESSAAFAFVLASDLQLEAQVLYPNARTASDAAHGLRSVLGRADLVLRLTGLPSTLARALVQAQGELLTASLTLSASDISSLSKRLLPLLENGTPACGKLSDASPGAGGTIEPDSTVTAPTKPEARHVHR